MKILKDLNTNKDKKIEENFIDLRKQSKILFNYAPDAYYISDMKGNFIEGNRAAEKLIGCNKYELLGKSFLKLNILPKSQIAKAAKLLSLNILGKSTGPDEFILNKKNGSQVVVEIRTYPVKIDGKRVVLGIARDITTHKELERNLQEAKDKLELKVEERTKKLLDLNKLLENSEKKYKSLFENAPDFIATVNRKGIITSCNNIIEPIAGYSKSEIIGKHFTKIRCLMAKNIPRYIDLYNASLTGRKIKPFEISLRHKNGKILYGEVRVSLIKKGSKTVGFQLVIRDITDSKKAEARLVESQERQKELYEDAPDGIITTNKVGIITSCNKIVYRFTGYSPKDLVGKHFTKTAGMIPKDIPKYLKVYSSLLRGKYTKPFEITLKDKYKNLLSLEVHFGIIRNNDKIDGFQLILRDISEKKESGKALVDSEKRFKLLSEATSEGVLIHNKGKIIDGNDNLTKMFGITRSKGIGQSILKFVTPKTKVSVIKNMLSGYSKHYYGMAVRKDKSRFPIEICAKTIPYKDQKVRVASIKDLTPYKEAQRAIKESEEKFKQLAEMLPEMVFEVDPKGEVKYVNKVGYKLFGYTKKDIQRGLNIFKVTDKKDHRRLKENMRKILRGNNLGPNEYIVIKKGGQRFPAEVRSNTSIDNKGEPIGLRSILIDITERKKAEDKIKHLSFHDYLTGIYNRAYFEEELKRLDTERQLPLSIVIGDVNGLKIINDAFGHKKGDEILCKIAKILKGAFRGEDIVARWGGDEFAIILPNTTCEDTLKIINRVNIICKKDSIKTTEVNPIN